MQEQVSRPDSNTLLEIARQAQNLTGAETAVVALAENDGEFIYYADAVGKHADWIRGRRGASAGSGLCGVAFQGYSPVLVCNTAGDSRVRQDHAELLGITSALGAPLRFQNRLLGAVLLFNKNDGSEFDSQDESTLAHYSEEAAPRLADYLETAAAVEES
jgi:GAF domain-containing protein